MGPSLSTLQNQTTYAILNRHRKDIRCLVNLNDLLLYLPAETDGNFLTPEENELLCRNGCTINNEKTNDLIRIIWSKGKDGLPAFMKALKGSEHKGHKELYDILLKDLKETSPAMYDAVLQFVGDRISNASANEGMQDETSSDSSSVAETDPFIQQGDRISNGENPSANVGRNARMQDETSSDSSSVEIDLGQYVQQGYTAIVLLMMFGALLGIGLIGLGASGYRERLSCKKKHYILPFHIVAGITILLGLLSLLLILAWKRNKASNQRPTDSPELFWKKCVRVLIKVCLFLTVILTCMAVCVHLTILCLAIAELFDGKLDFDGCHPVQVYFGLVMIVVTIVAAVGALIGIMVYCLRYICCRPSSRYRGARPAVM